MKKWVNLLFLFVLFFSIFSCKNAYALDTGTVVPQRFGVYDISSNTENVLNITSYSYVGANLYGYTFSGQNLRTRLSWYFDNSNLKVDTSYDLEFYMLLNLRSTSSFGLRGYIEDSTGFINSCDVSASSNNRTTNDMGWSDMSFDYTAVVSCKNVILKNKNFSFKLADVYSVAQGAIAISSVSYKTSNSDELVENSRKQLQEQQETNDTLNDTNVSDSQSQASGFFGNFSSNSHGLSGVISAPLRLIQSLSSASCSSLQVPIPFVNQNVTLTCMSSIYNQYFSSFLTLYRLITTGLIGYWVLVRLFAKVKDFQNPDSSKVEVFDL